MTRYILVGGYPRKAQDGGRAFAEELVKGFDGEIRILECLFARPRENWDEAYKEDTEFFTKHLPKKHLEFQMALPERFAEQVRWANAIYIRGGASEKILIELQGQSEGWQKELDGKTLAGSSAGAHAIARYYYDLDDLRVREGLGLLEVKVLVHYRSNYNAPNIDWNKAYGELSNHEEQLPLFALKEGEFTVKSQ